jgi:hypothetical protein
MDVKTVSYLVGARAVIAPSVGIHRLQCFVAAWQAVTEEGAIDAWHVTVVVAVTVQKEGDN